MRRWQCAALLAAVVVAGCTYSPPGSGTRTLDGGRTICAPRAPRSAVELQSVFDTRGPWWAGADGGFAVDLPDGRRLWLFGDTFVGGPDPGTRRMSRMTHPMVNNSVLVQDGACFKVMMGGAPGGPTAAAFTPPVPGTLWWPTAGYFDTARQKVVLFMARQEVGTFANDGMDEVDLSWPGLVAEASRPLPFDTGSGGPTFGTTVAVDGGYLYAYGTAGHATQVARTVWPRTPGGAWQVWDGTGWSQGPAAPMAYEGAAARSTMQVRKVGDRYVAVGQSWDGVTDDISQWSSANPWGPWRHDGVLLRTGAKVGTRSYGGRVVALPGGAQVVTYSVNPWYWNDILDDLLRYSVQVRPYVPAAVAGR